MKNMAVYCGSNLGENKHFYDGALQLGKALVAHQFRLVYGGGKIGLMGAVADSVLENNGEVIGIIPSFLVEKEVAHLGLTELIETADMTLRKAKMIELADGFIAMPGGIGTYEELFEVLSQAQLKIHHKPIGLLNIDGFFNPLLTMLEKTADAGFMPKENMTLICHDAHPNELLKKMSAYQPQDAVKWSQPAWAKKSK